VANIDIAPTLYELAHLPVPPEVDGLSLLPLMTQETIQWRSWLLIEGWPGAHTYQALRTDQYLYVETVGDISELYDSTDDPYQLQNQSANPAYAAVVDELHGILAGFTSAAQPALHWRILPFLMQELGLDD
jgi:arylsulfatase A-like enzyme